MCMSLQTVSRIIAILDNQILTKARFLFQAKGCVVCLETHSSVACGQKCVIHGEEHFTVVLISICSESFCLQQNNRCDD